MSFTFSAELFVDINGQADSNCSVDTPCTTLARALSLSQASDTINIASGSYQSDSCASPALTHPVTIQGTGSPTIACGGETAISATLASTDVLTVDGMVFTDSLLGIEQIGGSAVLTNTNLNGFVVFMTDLQSLAVDTVVARNASDMSYSFAAEPGAITISDSNIAESPVSLLLQDFTDGLLNISKSLFANTTAGGLVVSISGNVTRSLVHVEQCTFFNNSGSDYGGFVIESLSFGDSMKTVLFNNTFELNHITGQDSQNCASAGVIQMGSGQTNNERMNETVDVFLNVFLSETADISNAGLLIKLSSKETDSIAINVTGNVFDKCTAPYGDDAQIDVVSGVKLLFGAGTLQNQCDLIVSGNSFSDMVGINRGFLGSLQNVTAMGLTSEWNRGDSITNMNILWLEFQLDLSNPHYLFQNNTAFGLVIFYVRIVENEHLEVYSNTDTIVSVNYGSTATLPVSQFQYNELVTINIVANKNSIDTGTFLISDCFLAEFRFASADLVNSSITMANSTVELLTIFDFKGSVSHNTVSLGEMVFSGSVFFKHISSFLNNTYTISDCNFEGIHGGALILESSHTIESLHLLVLRSSFLSVNAPEHSILDLRIHHNITDSVVEIHENVFQDCYGYLSGGIDMKAKDFIEYTSLNVSNNYFTNNNGLYSGSVFIRSDSATDFQATFQENEYIYNEGSDAPGVIMLCDTPCSGLSVYCKNEIFDSNVGIYGPLFFAFNSKTENITIDSCLFKQNQAEIGAALFASAYAEFIFKNTQFIHNHATVGGALFIFRTTGISLEFSDFHHNHAETASAMFAVTNDGDVNFTHTSVVAREEDANMFLFDPNYPVIDEDSSFLCPPGYVFKSRETNIAFGSVRKSVELVCDPCPYGTYSILEGSRKGGAICFDCPQEGARCLGKDSISSLSHYWGMPTNSSGEIKFYLCPETFCNHDSTEITDFPYDYCDNNRAGVLCGECKEGYTMARRLGSHCVENEFCEGSAWQYYLVGSIITGVYAVILMLRPHGNAGPFAVLAYFFQTLSFLLPGSYSNTVSSIQGLAMFLVSIFTLQFYIGLEKAGVCPGSSLDANEVHSMRLFEIALFFLSLLIVWPIYARLTKHTKSRSKLRSQVLQNVRGHLLDAYDSQEPEEGKEVIGFLKWKITTPKERFVAGLTTISLLTYIPIAVTLLEYVRCVPVLTQDEEQWRVYTMGSLICYSWNQKLSVAILALIIIPAPAFLLLVSRLIQDRYPSDMPGVFRAILISIETPFKKKYWYWRSLMLYRALLTSILWVFLKNSLLRALLISFIALFSLILQIITKPYRIEMTNSLESLLLAVQVVLSNININNSVSIGSSTPETDDAMQDSTAMMLIISGSVLVITLILPMFGGSLLLFARKLIERFSLPPEPHDD